MTFYAVGKPNKEFRTIEGEASAQLNKRAGEVIVEVDQTGLRGKISADGKSIVLHVASMEEELDKIRQRRTSLLARCDFILMPDAPFTAAEVEEWKAYRMELRDITDTQPETKFEDIVWPEPPFPLP
ncbi:phage tail assembly chaperone [Sphingobium sp. LSP13-1-1.1]|uniref:phage tail assembly chaperone n=1 Tax=Sphingobium sp. LSP13-1-1.1 TaxID=3135234 RepID=UPI00344A500E